MVENSLSVFILQARAWNVFTEMSASPTTPNFAKFACPAKSCSPRLTESGVEGPDLDVAVGD